LKTINKLTTRKLASRTAYVIGTCVTTEKEATKYSYLQEENP